MLGCQHKLPSCVMRECFLCYDVLNMFVITTFVVVLWRLVFKPVAFVYISLIISVGYEDN